MDILSNNLEIINQQENEVLEYETRIMDDKGNVKFRHNKYTHLVNERTITKVKNTAMKEIMYRRNYRQHENKLNAKVYSHLAGTSRRV